MSEFERDLRADLRRVAAPPGFTDRVISSAAARERGQTGRTRGWLAAMVLLGVLSGATIVEVRHQEHRKAAAAQQQFETAMRITERTLSQVEERIGKVTFKSNEVEQ